MRLSPSRRLLAVWLALFALVALIALIEYEDAARSAQETGEENLLLPLPVAQLGAIELGAAGALHRFERDAGGAWFHHGAHAGSEAAHAHQADPAAAQRIAAVFGALGRARIERRIPYDGNSREYGVMPPRILLVIYTGEDARPLAQYAIGDVAPDSFSRYAHRAGSAEVVTIPNYHVENLLTLTRPAP